MRYRTVFEVGNHWNESYLPFIFTGLGFAFVGVCLCIVAACLWRTKVPRLLVFYVAALGSVMTIVTTTWTISALQQFRMDQAHEKAALDVGGCSTVSGNVRDFHPQSSDGKRSEDFIVGPIRFYYNSYVINGGFNKTLIEGGPIKNGLPVRICYLDGRILKLEVGD